MSQLTTIHHVTIQVANIPQALAWYRSSFDCEVLFEDVREAILQFENIRLCLSLPNTQQRHVAFVRDDAATLGELFTQADGIRSTLLSDPSGNVVEIVASESLKEST